MEIKHIKKQYGARFCLEIESLVLPENTKIAILGANGSGKSTLLKILAGIIENDAEKIVLKNVGYLPQQSYAFDKTVLQNVELSLWDEKRETRKEKALKALELTGMDALKDARAITLSGGETQRMALSRVLARNPKLLLLDEPTAACDIEGETQIENALLQFRGTLLFSTHSPAQALRVADQILFLDNGSLIEIGKTKDVLFTPKHSRVKTYMQHWRVSDDA